MAKNKYPFLGRFVNYIEGCCKDNKLPFFPLIDTSKINPKIIGDYLNCREFFRQHSIWGRKKMRKK